MSAKPYDEKRVRAALEAFQMSSGLRDYPWEMASGVGAGTLRSFRNGRNRAMSNATYEKFAAGASVLLGRDVTAAELRGDPGMPRRVQVTSFVGTDDQIVPIPADAPADWVAAPPGMDNAEATEVRGRSMMPLYRSGDLLFFQRTDTDPGRFKDDVVVVQLGDGRQVVKLLQAGTRRGRFTLVSINPAIPPLENQGIDWVGPIEWVNKLRR